MGLLARLLSDYIALIAMRCKALKLNGTDLRLVGNAHHTGY